MYKIGPWEHWLVTAGFRFDGGVLTYQHYPDLTSLLFRLVVDTDRQKFHQPLVQLWQPIDWQPLARWAVITSVVAVSSLLGLSQISAFLYFQF